MFPGYAVAWWMVAMTQGPDRLIPPVVALWLVAIPLIDTLAVMLRRVLKARSPFTADREHFHRLLLTAGCSSRQVLVSIVGLAIGAAALGIGGWLAGVPESTLFVAFLLFFGAHFVLLRTLRAKESEARARSPR